MCTCSRFHSQGTLQILHIKEFTALGENCICKKSTLHHMMSFGSVMVVIDTAACSVSPSGLRLEDSGASVELSELS